VNAMTNPAPRPALKLYQPYPTYSFRAKAPAIDDVRTAMRESGMTYREIHEASGVSISCIYQWLYGTTRCPTHAALMAVLRACGYDYKLVRMARVINLAERRRKRA